MILVVTSASIAWLSTAGVLTLPIIVVASAMLGYWRIEISFEKYCSWERKYVGLIIKL
jgi:hypothetical protein